jgi:hypothetical protein
MGWSIARDPVGSMTTRDYLHDLFTMVRDGVVTQDVIASHRKGTTHYLALRVSEVGKPVFVTALVVLTKGCPSRPGFGYKAMDERFGPYECDAQGWLLDLLSPIEALGDPPGWAQAWRDRCRAQLAQAKAAA